MLIEISRISLVIGVMMSQFTGVTSDYLILGVGGIMDNKIYTPEEHRILKDTQDNAKSEYYYIKIKEFISTHITKMHN